MRHALLLSAASVAVLVGALCAQSDDDLDLLPFSFGNNYFQAGIHYIEGPKVLFGQLATMSSPPLELIGNATGVENRLYQDGFVALDARVDADKNPVNDGFTDIWTMNSVSQVTPENDIAFHAYNIGPTGASAKATGASGTGWDISLGRKVINLGRRAELGLTAGFGFTGVNAKTRSTLRVSMETVTDTYSVNGAPPLFAPYSAPTFLTVGQVDADGNPVLNDDGTQKTEIQETSILLGDQPLSRSFSDTMVDVDGFWQIRGAYYTFRFGPTLSMPLGKRMKLNMGAGAAFAYVGTNYRTREIVVVDEDNTLDTELSSNRAVLLPSYYANANAEYWLSPRTGLFLGAFYQGEMDYSQTLGERTATVGFDNAVGFQSGVSVRF